MNAETRAKEIAMTPEERARAFVQEHRGFDLDGNCWFIACDRAEANLTQALRKAENDKLEEARQRILEGHDEAWGNPAEQHGWDKAAERVAALISKKD